jgi:Domain of unknown function (DUF4082)
MKYTKPPKHIISLRYLYFALGLLGILMAALANSPAPTQAALTPAAAAASYDGRLERADCTQISGYALDQNDPYLTLYVDIYDNGTPIGTVSAHRFRQDLYNSGMVNPYHGFMFPTPSSVKDGKVHRISVKFGGTFIDLSGSPRDIACDSSLFPTAVPLSIASAEGKTWEQGVEFSSSMSGIIQKVKFWRAAGELVGGHRARIWSTSGTLLKSEPFIESGTPGLPGNPGWQTATVNFPITAGVRYRVTFNLNYEGAKTFNVFSNGPITKGPLTAWGSYYSTPAGSFPTTYSTSNLFADIVFNSPR